MKIIEYIKLVPKGVKNASKVIEGIKNDYDFVNGNLTKEEAEEIIRRRLICSSCPFMSTNAVRIGVYKTERTDEHCTLCTCNINFKTACLSCNSGIEDHNEKNKENPLDLKWVAFKTEEDGKN